MGITTYKTRKESLQEIVAEWRSLGYPWPSPLVPICEWALVTGRIDFSQTSQARVIAREMQAALREEYTTDPQGRRVRRKHCYPVQTPSGIKTQRTFVWCDIESAEPEEMRAAVTYRRGQIVSDAKQLKTDVDSYNDNNANGAFIPLQLDLRDDMVELEQDTEYNPPPPPANE